MSGSANECQRIIAQRRPPPSLLNKRQLTAAVRPKAAIPLPTQLGWTLLRAQALAFAVNPARLHRGALSFPEMRYAWHGA